MSAVPHDPHAAAAQPASAGDDLFSDVEFGQISAEIGASLRAELDDATAFLEESAPAAAVPQRSSEYIGAPVLTSEPTPEIALFETSEHAPEHAAIAPRTRSAARSAEPQRVSLLAMFANGELVPWLLAGVALINLGIGIGALTSTVSERETAPADAAPVTGPVDGPAKGSVNASVDAPAHAAIQKALDDGPERRAPLSDAKPEGYRTLELARARLDRGEWERARTMLMSQLAVIDGISEPARSDIEARADFMIAESYRLQAAALQSTSRGQDK